MDALTHVFLPLTVAYVLYPELFPRKRYLLIGTAGLIPDFDKLIGVPGLFHSLVTMVPLCVLFVAIARVTGTQPYGRLASAFVLSHLLLDFLEGVSVPWLYPIVTTGVGLATPMRVVFGEGLLGFRFEGWPVALDFGETREGYATSSDVDTNAFGFIDGYGVTSALVFFVVYIGESWKESATNTSPKTD